MPAAPTKAAPKKAAPAKRVTPAKAAPPEPTTDSDESADTTTPATLRLKELVDRVAASTGGKKKGVKEVVEATLTQLGLALHNGEMLNLPAFGKVRVAKPQGAAPGSAMTLKLRPSGPSNRKKPADGALAEPAEHG